MKVNNIIHITKILLIMLILIFSSYKIAWAKMEMFCEGLQVYYEINNMNSENVSDRIKVKAKFTNDQWVKFDGQGISGNYKRTCKLLNSRVFCDYKGAGVNTIIDFNNKFLKIFDSGETHNFDCFVSSKKVVEEKPNKTVFPKTKKEIDNIFRWNNFKIGMDFTVAKTKLREQCEYILESGAGLNCGYMNDTQIKYIILQEKGFIFKKLESINLTFDYNTNLFNKLVVYLSTKHKLDKPAYCYIAKGKFKYENISINDSRRDKASGCIGSFKNNQIRLRENRPLPSLLSKGSITILLNNKN